MNYQKHLRRWDNWLTRSAPPHTLAIVRIVFGAFLLLYFATYVPHITMVFSSQGTALPLHLDNVTGPLQILYMPPSPQDAHFLYAAFLLSCLLIAIGHMLPFACLATAAGFAYFWQINLHPFPASIHRVMFIILFVLCFSGADRAYSVRMWRRNGSWKTWEPICVLPQRLIAMQLTFTYFSSGWQKTYLPMWKGGEILWYSFTSNFATPLAFWIARLGLPMLAYDALVLGVKIFECMLPFGFWLKHWRVLTFIGGALFHILVALLLNIYSFLVLIPLYIVFLEPEDVQAFCDRYAWLRATKAK